MFSSFFAFHMLELVYSPRQKEKKKADLVHHIVLFHFFFVWKNYLF